MKNSNNNNNNNKKKKEKQRNNRNFTINKVFENFSCESNHPSRSMKS